MGNSWLDNTKISRVERNHFDLWLIDCVLQLAFKNHNRVLPR